MLAKIIITLAIGCSLTLASSQNEYLSQNPVRLQTRGIFGTLGSLISKATSAVTYPYRKAYDIFVQTALGVADYGAEKVQQVTKAYYEIKEAYLENLNAIKDEIIKKAIGELQNFVDILAKGADIESCAGVRESNQDLVTQGKATLDDLEQQLKDAVNDQLKDLENGLKQWEIETNMTIKD